MLYINPEMQKNSGISLREIPLLTVIMQNRSEDLSEYIKKEVSEKELEDFFKRGLIEFNKPKRKDQDKYELVRVTRKCRESLDIIRVPEITKKDKDMFDFLSLEYLKHEDKDRFIGNKTKTLSYVAIFRKYNNLTLHQMYYLIMHFLDNHIFTKKLENIFFDSNKNRHRKFEDNMGDSPLYQYMEKNIEEIENIWEKRIKKT